MNLLSRETLIPAALGLCLAAAAVLVSVTPTVTPRTSAVVRLWADLVRDIDRFGLAVTKVTPEEEKRIGDQIANGTRFNPTGDMKLELYVESVGYAMINAAGPQPFTYAFHVVDSSQINAFALPGGHIYITTGLLAVMTTEAELAAVLGHEISHVVLGHCIGRLQYELALEPIVGNQIAGLVNAAHRVLAAGYDSDQETEADRNGMLLSAKAGYNPRAAIGVMQIIAALEAGDVRDAKTVLREVARGVGSVLDIFQSHPEARQRIADLEAEIRRNASAWSGKQFYAGTRNYTEHISFGTTAYPAESSPLAR